MTKPVLLDLFCGVGGAAMGYYQAGFEVLGVDKYRQPHYPFPFVQGDVFDVLETPIRADAIHASPPCQKFSDLSKQNGNQIVHLDLIGELRELLELQRLPYVIENVEGAPLRDPKLICGTERGLTADGFRLRRHRLFETNWPLKTAGCACADSELPVLDVSGGGPTRLRREGGGGRPFKGSADQVRRIMGISWANRDEVKQAVPPAYTRLVGDQLLPYLVAHERAPAHT